MRMVGTEVVGSLHAADPEPDSGSHLDHSENGSSGSNEELNGDRSPLPPHSNYDSGDGAIPVHRCEKCESYETLSRTALVAHMSRCSLATSDTDNDGRRGERKLFECDVCNMKFSNGANMRRHKMRHTGVKPYECRVCSKRFFRKDHLAEHFTTHTKTLPYHCPICNRGFQRQIAMRAHFQNEHVGQHDMIKSCPLCSFRAGTMKSLRVHFFNRHGIDLDNPGTNPVAVALKAEATPSAVYSDSGDSLGGRSADNATPPMHFLTPHVEISMTEASAYASSRPEPAPSEPQASDLSSSPGSGDSNVPSSSHPGDGDRDSPVSVPPSPTLPMPALSVIPLVKQESTDSDRDDIYNDKKRGNSPVNLSMNNKHANNNGSSNNHLNGNHNGHRNSVSPQPQTQISPASLIKVSPLKSLLRDDLKRKLTSRANMRMRGPEEAGVIGAGDRPSLQSIPPLLPGLPGGEEAPLRKEHIPAHVLAMRNLQCVFCGIWFPDQTLYFLHKGCHCESNPWKCNICGEQCGNVYQFNSHLLSNTHQ